MCTSALNLDQRVYPFAIATIPSGPHRLNDLILFPDASSRTYLDTTLPCADLSNPAKLADFGSIPPAAPGPVPEMSCPSEDRVGLLTSVALHRARLPPIASHLSHPAGSR
jgi:hypothetical protein